MSSSLLPDAPNWSKALPARVVIAPEVLHQIVEGQAVLLELTGQRYFSLDEVGTQIWSLLEEDPDVERVDQHLLARYDTTEATIRKDLLDLINRLAETGLVLVEP